jgi:hypothetical protein
MADPAGGIRRAFEHLDRDRAAARVLFGEAAGAVGGNGFARHRQTIYDRFVDDIEAVIADAQRAGLIVDEARAPARLVAFGIAALIGQLAMRRLTERGAARQDPGELADFVIRLVLEGLLPR